jgi:hypothetical protein
MRIEGRVGWEMGMFVNYTVSNRQPPLLMQAGPYASDFLARENADDIRGYDGITDVRIVADRDETRSLVS